MSYATVDELAEALRIRVTPANTALLTACLEAAAGEIDHFCDRVDPMPVPTPAEINRTNVNRGVEWFKANDVAFGAGGFEQTGLLKAPGDDFERHTSGIIHYKQQWAVA